ncbi:PQ loop repeat-domain-containing protein [Mycotypha africana]|uniref:PQ loop repeat-domain-containing protein n=1 Tax=Mycotypha africana TaxID=64632 RepID=UPI00230060D4|nr:PQ loop repeat-domain-containing protein [Mycotypha africana]KAI8987343.1 PQ loop repeat-domain-containing protein [Mycotypha africana]
MNSMVNYEFINSVDYTIIAGFVSNFLGYASIGCWLCAQLPQILENNRLKSADGLSLYLLYFWLAGDVGNMYSCILNHQLPFQIYESIYFVCTDLTLLFQYFSFRHNKPGRLVSVEETVAHTTMAVIAEDNQSNSNRPKSMNNDETGTSSRLFNRAEPSWENENDQRLLYGAAQNNYGALSNHTDGSKKPTTTTTTTTTTSTVLMSLFIVGYKSISSFPSTITTTTTTTTAAPDDLSHTIAVTSMFIDNEMFTFGWVLAWICSGFYILARIPQIHKNHKRHSTEGLSIALFTFSVCGNLTYAASILTHPGHTYQSFIESLPYIVGCFGSLMLDVIIFGQFVSYKNANKEIAKV